MSKILVDKGVLEQALEALEYHVEQTRPIWKTSEAIAALEAALAEPVQEPVKQCMAHGECFGGECIYQRPAEPVQEPIGYLWPTGRHPEFRFTQQKRDGVDGTPVYTAPPQRKPLTEEEIRDLLEAEFLGRDGKRSWDDDLQVFRLAERAHRIGE